jgi:hypothetical protein
MDSICGQAGRIIRKSPAEAGLIGFADLPDYNSGQVAAEAPLSGWIIGKS